MGLKLVMIRFSIIAPMTNTREQTKGLMMCLILNWNVFASCLMMWLINLLRGDLEDDDEILDERAVLTIAAIVLNNPLHNEKHLAEILESFSIVGEYEISFVHLGIVMGFISMYKDEVEECENLTEEDADYIIDIDGIKFHIFNI